jgi:5-methyltetrahydropteroyltriglutamate--homocysteine methyltransferase
MAFATSLGFPRIGPNRELKKAVEAYWAKKSTLAELDAAAAAIRARNWTTQQSAGLEHIACNDFTYYDHIVELTLTLGLIPSRFRALEAGPKTDLLFALSRGVPTAGGPGIAAQDMTKWFDTNYHYIVPEFEAGMTPRLANTKIVDEFRAAKAAGVKGARPVLVGPVTYLLLGKSRSASLRPLDLLPEVLNVYEQLLKQLSAEGATWVQLDEPCLALDLPDAAHKALKTSCARLAAASPSVKLLLTTYFGDLSQGDGQNLKTALSLDAAGLHLDLVRGPAQLKPVLDQLPAGRVLSLGVVDGRNIWRNDLDASLSTLETAAAKISSDRLFVAPSCSLLHSPVDLASETTREGEYGLDAEVKSWLAFATQKCAEIATLTKGLNQGRAAIATELAASNAAQQARRTSTRTRRPDVRTRAAAVSPDQLRRRSPFAARRSLQIKHLNLPALPTTSIGSFPQTKEIRAARAAFLAGEHTVETYENFIKDEIKRTIVKQEELGLDVLVHGEAERNDMIEYFAPQLDGFAVTRNGWVQSYGSRCVKPPIIYGDVARPKPMTVRWATFAQSCAKKPVKGMLTGPVTILQWSFVRNDQPRSETCRQIGLAIRDEVTDLEKAGISVIQIDEPAIREGLPLRKGDAPAYLAWAVDCFKLSSTGVKDETQIHTHMCYSEFNEILPSIAAMDADVLLIEASRSNMELLGGFAEQKYPNEVGPGVYDIHSPRVPTTDEVVSLLEAALRVLEPWQVWVNPDCGLKTRRWEEVEPSLANMVAGAKIVRERLAKEGVELKPRATSLR